MSSVDWYMYNAFAKEIQAIKAKEISEELQVVLDYLEQRCLSLLG